MVIGSIDLVHFLGRKKGGTGQSLKFKCLLTIDGGHQSVRKAKERTLRERAMSRKSDQMCGAILEVRFRNFPVSSLTTPTISWDHYLLSGDFPSSLPTSQMPRYYLLVFFLCTSSAELAPTI